MPGMSCGQMVVSNVCSPKGVVAVLRRHSIARAVVDGQLAIQWSLVSKMNIVHATGFSHYAILESDRLGARDNRRCGGAAAQ